MGHFIYFNEPFDVPFLSHGKLGLQKRQRYAFSLPTPNKTKAEKKNGNGNTSQPQNRRETLRECSYTTRTTLQGLDKQRRRQESVSNGRLLSVAGWEDVLPPWEAGLFRRFLLSKTLWPLGRRWRRESHAWEDVYGRSSYIRMIWNFRFWQPSWDPSKQLVLLDSVPCRDPGAHLNLDLGHRLVT